MSWSIYANNLRSTKHPYQIKPHKIVFQQAIKETSKVISIIRMAKRMGQTPMMTLLLKPPIIGTSLTSVG